MVCSRLSRFDLWFTSVYGSEWLWVFQWNGLYMVFSGLCGFGCFGRFCGLGCFSGVCGMGLQLTCCFVMFQWIGGFGCFNRP